MDNFINLHKETLSFFSDAVQSGKLGHAYLFYGYEGIGKEAFTLDVIGRLLCEKNSFDRCGVCTSCKQFSKLWHPDFHYIFPLPGKSHYSESDLAEAIQQKSFNPFTRLKLTGQNDYIGIQTIRSLKKELFMEPQQGSRRVAFIQDVDKMRSEAANSLLKILEEPPSHVIFFLTTSRISRLLPTVISRCQVIHFDKPEPVTALEALAPLVESESKHAFSRALRFSDFNIKKAFDYIHGQFQDVLEPIEELVLAFLDNNPFLVNRSLHRIKELNNRESISVALELLALYFRDLMVYLKKIPIAMQNESFIKNISGIDSTSIPETFLIEIIDLILRVRDEFLSDYNFNSHLLLEKLFYKMFIIRESIEGVQNAS